MSEECDDLDPRIQIELEKLNNTTDEINKLEIEYDEANATYSMLLKEYIRRLNVLSKKLGSCIEKSRPYYKLLEEAKEAQENCKEAAALYKKAHGVHMAAKETVALAEQRFLDNQHQWQFDNAWQEMLNHATMKVMEAETEKAERDREHRRLTKIAKNLEETLKQIEEKHQKSISKSRPYFEEKRLCQEQLNTQIKRIETLKTDIIKTKRSYAQTLKNLEQISNEIHSRRNGLGQREPGVGAELNTAFEEIALVGVKFRSLPDVSVLDKCDCPSGGGDEDEIDSIKGGLDKLSVRPVEGKCENVFVTEFNTAHSDTQ